MKMKRMMIMITMMLPLMTFASLFSERSGEIFQATREGPGEGVVEPDAPRVQSKVGGVV
jgi:hypothetical protein